jgi:hypothetical protein
LRASAARPTHALRLSQFVLLGALGVAIALFVGRYQLFPGYLDSDYYFGGGIQLAAGRGFTEPYIWNYLDNPQTLPHPSHTYWMPLASILAAIGMVLTGNYSYASGRLAFIVIAGFVPIATATLAYSLSHRRELAFVAGLLAVFSIYYAPFLPVTDNYGPYLVLGALFLVVLESPALTAAPLLGILAGLMALARSDGILWLGLAGLAAAIRTAQPRDLATGGQHGPASDTWMSALIARIIGRWSLIVLGFLLVTGPWFWRTFSVFGTILAPGGSHLLWLRNYDETFTYPASILSFWRWAGQGVGPILAARVASLRWNLLNAFAAQGGIFLLPFVLVGAWIHRRDLRVRVGCVAWILLLTTMSFVFPFAGARGGFFHSGAAIQALWWSLAPIGLDAVVTAARRRNLFTPNAHAVFRAGLVGVAALMTAVIMAIRVFPGWGEGEQDYPKIEAFLVQNGIRPNEPVMVRNPPGYYLMTGRSAVVVPYGNAAAMSAVADKFSARYLILEPAGAAGPIGQVYNMTDGRDFEYLGEIDGTRILFIGH